MLSILERNGGNNFLIGINENIFNFKNIVLF